MSAVRVGFLEPGTPEWHEARTDGLGGSEVAAALGLSPWCSPFTLWHRKRGMVGPTQEDESMYWGKLLEPIVRDHYERRIGRLVAPGGTYRDGWRIASPDGELADRLWEGKTADKDDAFEWGKDGSDDADAIPPYYRVQCLWYMDVLDVHALTLSVLIGGNDYREYDVPWDDDEVADIRARAEVFWRTVVNNERPAIDDSTSTYQTVREMHPDIDGTDAEIPADVADEYLTTDLEAKAAKKAAQRAKTTLLDHMGEARYAVTGGIRIARRQPANGGAVALYPLHEETP